MPNLKTIELKAFLPSKDFRNSLQFYEQLGFTLEPLGDDLAAVAHASTRFLLSDSYSREFAEGLELHLLVENVDDWFARATEVVELHGMKIDAPVDQPWGLRDFTFLDPSGVCWRVAQEVPIDQ